MMFQTVAVISKVCLVLIRLLIKYKEIEFQLRVSLISLFSNGVFIKEVVYNNMKTSSYNVTSELKCNKM